MRRIILLTLLITFAVPALATDPNPSAKQRELIEQLLQSMNVDRMSKSILDSMYTQIERQFMQEAEARGNDADSIAESRELFAAFREKSQAINFGELLREEQIRIYAKYFTEAELTDMVAFYKSPTGQKMIDVMPQIMSEGMRAGVDNVTPRIQEIMKQVMEEQETRHPWRRTMSDMQTIAAELESYEDDSDDQTYPQAGDINALKSALKASDKFPVKDIWGHPYEYAVSPDRHHYRIVSAGADGIFEWDSRKIDAKDAAPSHAIRYRDRLEDDFIYANDGFVQLPVQAKPKAQKAN